EELKGREEGGQRQHGERHTPRRLSDDVGQEPGAGHGRSSPSSRMTTIGPADATPSSPNPSATAERSPSTELRPSVTASSTGAVSTPVVTLPASYATEMNASGVTNDSRMMLANMTVSSRLIEKPTTTRRSAT